jgi:hypothetical protein
MRTFAWATLGLAVFYAVLQTGASDRLGQGSGIVVSTLRRLSDPTVAPIHQAPIPGSTWHAGTPPATGGGGTQHLPHTGGPALPPTTVQV